MRVSSIAAFLIAFVSVGRLLTAASFVGNNNNATFPEYIWYDSQRGVCVSFDPEDTTYGGTSDLGKCSKLGVSGLRYLPEGKGTEKTLVALLDRKLDEIGSIFNNIKGGKECEKYIKTQICQTVLAPCLHVPVSVEEGGNGGEGKGQSGNKPNTPGSGGDNGKGGGGKGQSGSKPGEGESGSPTKCWKECAQEVCGAQVDHVFCPNSYTSGCECSVYVQKAIRRPCNSFCQDLHQKCANVADKLPKSLLLDCNSVFPAPNSVQNASNAPGVLNVYDNWIGKEMIYPFAAGESYESFIINGKPKRAKLSIDCFLPTIIEDVCNVSRLETLCPLPFVSSVDEIECTVECKTPCPSYLYEFDIDGWQTLRLPFVAFGCAALFFNAWILVVETNRMRQNSGGNWLILVCAFSGVAYALIGVVPAAEKGNDVFCNENRYLSAWEDERDPNIACTLSKFSVFLLHAFIYSSGCSVASFYYKLHSSVMFSPRPKNQNKVHAIIIFMLPSLFAFVAHLSEFTGKEERALLKSDHLPVDLNDKVVALKTRDEMHSIQSGFGACQLDLTLGASLILIDAPMLLGLVCTLLFSARTARLLKLAAAHAPSDAILSSARSMTRFAIVASVCILIKMAAMTTFYPQLAAFSDAMLNVSFCSSLHCFSTRMLTFVLQYTTCFEIDAFLNNPAAGGKHLRSLPVCMDKMGIFKAHQCINIAQNFCGIVPTLPSFAMRMQIMSTVSLPLWFGLLFSYKLVDKALMDRCCKMAARRYVVPATTITETTENSIKTTGDSSIVTTHASSSINPSLSHQNSIKSASSGEVTYT